MELYKLKRGDHFILKEKPTIPPAAPEGNEELTYIYTHVDGAYAPCHDTKYNDRYYFAAWTDVEKMNEPNSI
jgi:hypothetical protein